MRIVLAALLLFSLTACKHDEPRPAASAGESPDGGAVSRIEQAGRGVEAAGRAAATDLADAGSRAVGRAEDAVRAGASNALDAGVGAVERAADAGVWAIEHAKASIENVKLPDPPVLPATPLGLNELDDSKDNPTTRAKVALGYQLFFDKRLSKDGSMSCESCHHPEKAWTSGQALDVKAGGAKNKRNAPTMLNVAYHSSFYWDGRKPTLESVSEAAWTGQLGANGADVAARLNEVATYRAEFQRAFSQDASAANIPMALASFLRALKSGDSDWDKSEKGDTKAVSKEVRRGYKVFQSSRCTLCHVPPLYTDSDFHNVGIGSDKPDAERDHGRMDKTKDAKDDGKFKTPTLRDIARTGPYFHDGSVATLDEAIDFMLRGGKKNANLDEKLKPAKLAAKDRAALKAFLMSLSGTATFDKAPELP